MLCGFRVNGKIQGKGTIDNTARNLAFFTHLCQFSRLHSGRHLGIDHFHCRHWRYLGHVHTAGIADRNCIFDNIHFVFQGRICHECHVGQEQQPVNPLNLKHSHMGKRIPGAQTYLFVQNTLQKILGIDQSLHVHVCPAIMGQLYRLQGCRDHIRLVNDLITCQIHAYGIRHFPDLCFVSHQNSVGNASFLRFLHRFQYCRILRHRYSYCFPAAFLDLCHNVIKTLFHFPDYFLSAFL